MPSASITAAIASATAVLGIVLRGCIGPLRTVPTCDHEKLLLQTLGERLERGCPAGRVHDDASVSWGVVSGVAVLLFLSRDLVGLFLRRYWIEVRGGARLADSPVALGAPTASRPALKHTKVLKTIDGYSSEFKR
jgi:hypothetical protein